MDFRIITIPGNTQILLERIQNDEQWQVVMSVYLNTVHRYDEWVDCESVDAAKNFIANYEHHMVFEFTSRAIDWQETRTERMAKKTARHQ